MYYQQNPPSNPGLDNEQLKSTQTGVLPAANDLFNSPGMGYFYGPTVAGFTPDQQQGWDSSMAGANQSSAFADTMGNSFMSMANNPYMIDSAGGPQVSAQMMGAAPQVQSQNVDPYMLNAGNDIWAQQMQGPGQIGVDSMDYFNNPYMDQTVQNALNANNEAFMQGVMPGLEMDAIGAGMGGSTRQGISEGLAMQGLQDTNAETAARMYQGMYDTGMTNNLTQRSQDIGLQGQNIGNQMAVDQYNVGNNFASQQYNAQNDLARQQANQNASMQGQMANQQYGLQGQMANQNAWMDTNRANQAAGLTADMANASNWYGAEAQNQNAAQQSMAYMPGMMGAYTNAQMMPGMTQMAIGQQQQDYAQNQMDANFNEWMWNQQQPWTNMQNYSSVVQGTQGVGTPAFNPTNTGPDYGQAAAGMFDAMGNMSAGGAQSGYIAPAWNGGAAAGGGAGDVFGDMGFMPPVEW